MRNPLLLHILFFTQLQWLSVIAGILFSYFRNMKTALRRQWLILPSTITLVLLVQTLCTVLLISQMICGHLINATLQGFGGITFFTVGAFSYYWLPKNPTCLISLWVVSLVGSFSLGSKEFFYTATGVSNGACCLLLQASA